MDEKNSSVWLRCPKCGSKTRDKILPQTIMINYPLYCPKCKRELLVSVKNLSITIIKEPDAQTQGRQTCEKSQFVGSVLLYRKGRTSPPNKKKRSSAGCVPMLSFPSGLRFEVWRDFYVQAKAYHLLPPAYAGVYIHSIMDQRGQPVKKNPHLCMALLHPKSRCQISTRKKFNLHKP